MALLSWPLSIIKGLRSDTRYSSRFRLVDPNGDTLTYSSPNLPEGATLDPGTGLFSWTPGLYQGGQYWITITATDSTGLSSSQTANILVYYDNYAPRFDPLGERGIITGHYMEFSLHAWDWDNDDNDHLTYSAFNLPTGATFEQDIQGNCWFKWTPGKLQAGTYTVTFTVSDGYLSDSEDLVITVTAAGENAPPYFLCAALRSGRPLGRIVVHYLPYRH